MVWFSSHFIKTVVEFYSEHCRTIFLWVLVKCMLKFIRNCQTLLKGGCAILHYHQQYRRVSYPWQHFSSVHSLNHVQLFATPWTIYTRVPSPSPNPGACSNSSPASWWCHPTISSSFIPFSSCLQYFPASGSFLGSWIFASGDQSIGASASASVLPMNIQDSFPLGWTGWISLQSKGLSKVFSNTTIQKHQLFGVLPFSWSNSYIHIWLLDKP